MVLHVSKKYEEAFCSSEKFKIPESSKTTRHYANQYLFSRYSSVVIASQQHLYSKRITQPRQH